MAVATTQIGTIGRGIQFGNLSGIIVTVVATATTYNNATGGLPFDLTSILQQAAPAEWIAPNYIQAINPADVVGVLGLAPSANGYMPTNLVVGTPTYTAVPWQSVNGVAATPGILATCPATVHLGWAGAEVANGAVTDTVTFILLVQRNGANN